jgi:Lar family restriction alleviation protein
MNTSGEPDEKAAVVVPQSPPQEEGLLPCPFCGGEAKLCECLGEHWVACISCQASYPMSSNKDIAIAQWNTRAASPAAPSQLGWLYENPDTGTEWSDQHPVESGEVDGAQNVRPATLQNLKDELLEAWRGWDEARAALSTLSSQAAARQMTAPPDRSEPESR